MPPRKRALTAVPDPVPETGPNGATGYRKRSDNNGSPQSYEEEAWYYPNYESGDLETRERRWRSVPRDEARCRALIKSRNNPWYGSQCARLHSKGMSICLTHGGSLPSVRRAAERRLILASDPAAEKLIHMALFQRDIGDTDRLRALVQILDRAGVAGKKTIEVEVKTWQKVLQRVYGNMNEDGEGADLELEEGVDFEVLPAGEVFTED